MRGRLSDPPQMKWLVDAAKHGSSQALETLFDLNVLPVYRYALASLNDVSAAEQVTEAVFLRVAEHLNDYSFSALPFLAWLMRIVRSEVRVTRPTTARPGQPVVPDLSGLSDLEAEVLLLRFAAGLSVGQTAAALGLRQARVRALQHSAVLTVASAAAGRKQDPSADHRCPESEAAIA